MRLDHGSPHGFTLIEIILVLVLLGVLVAVVTPRSFVSDADTRSNAEGLKGHIRYVQLTAMKRAKVWGLRCDGTNYWAFNGTNPALAANQRPLPGESQTLVSLAGKSMSVAAFTLYFDDWGIPYSAYVSAASKTPLAAAQTITVNSVPAGSSVAITVTPDTGYVP